MYTIHMYTIAAIRYACIAVMVMVNSTAAAAVQYNVHQMALCVHVFVCSVVQCSERTCSSNGVCVFSKLCLSFPSSTLSVPSVFLARCPYRSVYFLRCSLYDIAVSFFGSSLQNKSKLKAEKQKQKQNARKWPLTWLTHSKRCASFLKQNNCG